MVNPTFEEFQELAKQGNVIPIYKEILADTETPVSAYLKTGGHGKYSFLLESVEGGEKIARYSFLGADPFLIFRSRNREVTIEDKTGEKNRYQGDPIEELRRLFGRYRPVQVEGLPRFTGGAVGYISYDAVRLIEDIPDETSDNLGLDEIVLPFYETILAFDNLKHRLVLISNVLLDDDIKDLRREYGLAVGKLERIEWSLSGLVDTRVPPAGRLGGVKSSLTKEEFEERVRKCKEYIKAGDIFQVVISQRFEAEVGVRPFDIYRMLRIVNPSPYMYYLKLNGIDVIGSSPELLVRVEDGIVETRPIAGTRPRGRDEGEDMLLAEELLADEKERAEHIMLVDLGRNDIGRVSEYGSVEVTELMEIECYSHVMHLISNVRGKLREGFDRFDVLFACFPAGTVSGAPKIRAMEIIDELEPKKRSIYAGAIGYIDFTGNLDSCITIRTILVKDGKAYVQAGAGIVADSVPEREYMETKNKAQALLKAMEMVGS